MLSTIRLRIPSLPAALLFGIAIAAPSGAQQAAPSPAPANAPAAAGAQAPAPKPTLDFSGVLFGNYQYNTGLSNKNANAFTLDRAYLTFRMAAGEHTSIRVTTDIFQDAEQQRLHGTRQVRLPAVRRAEVLQRRRAARLASASSRR